MTFKFIIHLHRASGGKASSVLPARLNGWPSSYSIFISLTYVQSHKTKTKKKRKWLKFIQIDTNTKLCHEIQRQRLERKSC